MKRTRLKEIGRKYTHVDVWSHSTTRNARCELAENFNARKPRELEKFSWVKFRSNDPHTHRQSVILDHIGRGLMIIVGEVNPSQPDSRDSSRYFGLLPLHKSTQVTMGTSSLAITSDDSFKLKWVQFEECRDDLYIWWVTNRREWWGCQWG